HSYSLCIRGYVEEFLTVPPPNGLRTSALRNHLLTAGCSIRCNRTNVHFAFSGLVRYISNVPAVRGKARLALRERSTQELSSLLFPLQPQQPQIQICATPIAPID